VCPIAWLGYSIARSSTIAQVCPIGYSIAMIARRAPLLGVPPHPMTLLGWGVGGRAVKDIMYIYIYSHIKIHICIYIYNYDYIYLSLSIDIYVYIYICIYNCMCGRGVALHVLFLQNQQSINHHSWQSLIVLLHRSLTFLRVRDEESTNGGG
jgi:hypothetical protein